MAANGLARPDLNKQVWLVYIGEDFKRAKPRNQKKVQKLIDEGRIKPFSDSSGIEIGEGVAKIKTPISSEEIPNDFVFVMIGGVNPKKFLSDCGIHFSQRPLG